MRAAVLALLALLCAHARAESSVIAIQPYMRNGEMTNSFTVSCNAGEEFDLLVDTLTIANATYNGKFTVTVECGTVRTFYNTQIVAYVPTITGTHTLQSEEIATYTRATNQKLYERAIAYENGDTLDEIEEQYRRRQVYNEHKARKRAPKSPCAPPGKNEDAVEAQQRCFLYTQCSVMNSADYAAGVAVTVTGSLGGPFGLGGLGDLAQTLPNCDRVMELYLDRIGLSGSQYDQSACSSVFEQPNNYATKKCLFQNVLLNYENSRRLNNLQAAFDQIADTFDSALRTIKAMEAQLLKVKQITDNLNARQSAMENQLLRMTETINGIVGFGMLAQQGIEQNRLQNQNTELLAISTAQGMQRADEERQRMYRRAAQQNRDANIVNLQNQQDIVDGFQTSVDVVVQQTLRIIIDANRRTNYDLLNKMRDQDIRMVDLAHQLNEALQYLGNTDNRHSSEIRRMTKIIDAQFYAWRNLTAFLLGSGDLGYIFHRSLDVLDEMNLEPILTSRGTPPRNLNEFNTLWQRKITVERRDFINPTGNLGTMCDQVYNGDYVADMNNYYLTEANATYRVPITYLKEYLRFGDTVYVRNGTFILNSGANCINCSPMISGTGARACMCSGGSCGTEVKLIIASAEDFETQAFIVNRTLSTSTSIYDGAEVVLLSVNKEDVFFMEANGLSQPSTGGSGFIADVDQFISYAAVYDPDEAKWIVRLETPPSNSLFPWLSVNENMYLTPKLASEAMQPQVWAFGSTNHTGGGKSYFCFENELATTHDSIRVTLDNSAGSLRRRGVEKTPTQVRAEFLQKRKEERIAELLQFKQAKQPSVRISKGKRYIGVSKLQLGISPNFFNKISNTTNVLQNNNSLKKKKSIVTSTTTLRHDGLWEYRDLLFSSIPTPEQIRLPGSGVRAFADSCTHGAAIVSLPDYITVAFPRNVDATARYDPVTGTPNEDVHILRLGETYVFPVGANIGLAYIEIPQGMALHISGTRILTDNLNVYTRLSDVFVSSYIVGPTQYHASVTQLYRIFGFMDWYNSQTTGKTNISPPTEFRMTAQRDSNNSARYTAVCLYVPPDQACPPRIVQAQVTWRDAYNVGAYGLGIFYGMNTYKTLNYMLNNRVSWQGGATVFPIAQDWNFYEPYLSAGKTWQTLVASGSAYRPIFQASDPGLVPGCNITSANSNVYVTNPLNTNDPLCTSATLNSTGYYGYRTTNIVAGNFVDLDRLSVFTDDLTTTSQVFQCGVPCYLITSRTMCTTTYEGLCEWFLDESVPSPKMTCGRPQQDETTNYPALAANVACTNATLHSTIAKCIEGGSNTSCAWDRYENNCRYYDATFDNTIEAITPCSKRLDRIVSWTACATGFDVDTDAFVANRYDYCFYKETGTAITCERLSNTTYTECFDPDVVCEFGIGGPNSDKSGEFLTYQFYADTADERDLYAYTYLGVASIPDLCEMYTSDVDCETKTVNSLMEAQCQYRSDKCIALCQHYSGLVQRCINAANGFACIYRQDDDVCMDNVADMTSIPECAPNNWSNCVSKREICNLYYYNQTACEADSECSWLFSSTDMTYTAHCERKLRVAVASCLDMSGMPGSSCDVENGGNVADLLAQQRDCIVFDTNNVTSCVESIDGSTGEHCVSVRVNYDTYFCFPPNSGVLADGVATWSKTVGFQLIYYENITSSDLYIQYIDFENTTYAAIEPLLRSAYQGLTVPTFSSSGIKLVPDGAYGWYSYPCTSVGYEVVGSVCCPPEDVIQVFDINVGGDTPQCRDVPSNSTRVKFENPAHPQNLYVTTATQLCANTNDTVYATPYNITRSIFYMCKLRPENVTISHDNDYCPDFWDEDGVDVDSYTCFAFIESTTCYDLNLCQRLPSICIIRINVEGKDIDMVRLDTVSLAQLSYAQSYPVYNGTVYKLEFISNLRSNMVGLAQDVFPSNVTGLTTDFLAGLNRQTVEIGFSNYIAQFGPNPLNWDTEPGSPVYKNTIFGSPNGDRQRLKVDEIVYGFKSPDYIPVYTWINPIITTTGKATIRNGTEIVQVIYPNSGTVFNDPYSNLLPQVGEFLIHEIDETRGYVISPPSRLIEMYAETRGRCNKIGYFQTHTSALTSIEVDAWLEKNPNYDPRCLTVAPITYASPIDYYTLNTTGVDWCGKIADPDLSRTDTWEHLVNLPMLATAPVVDESNNTLDVWWLEEMNSTVLTEEEKLGLLRSFRISWDLEGCPNIGVNYIAPEEATAECENCTTYYNVDKWRVLYEYGKLQITDNGYTLQQAIDAVRLDLIRPLVQAADHPQCGNCGEGYPTQCYFLPIYRVPVNSGLSARDGFCKFTRAHSPTWDRNLGAATFDSLFAVLQYTLDVPFSAVTTDVLVDVCPNPITYDCTPTASTNAQCVFIMTNPSTTTTLEVRFDVQSDTCAQPSQVRTLAKQQTFSLVVNLCNGNATVRIKSYDGTLTCLSLTQNYNLTDIQVAIESYNFATTTQVNSTVTSAINDVSTAINQDVDTLRTETTQRIDLLNATVTAQQTNLTGVVTDIITPAVANLTGQVEFIYGNLTTRITDITVNLTDVIARANTTEATVVALDDSLETLLNITNENAKQFTEQIDELGKQYMQLQTEFANLTNEVFENIANFTAEIDVLKGIIDDLFNGSGSLLLSGTDGTARTWAYVATALGAIGTATGAAALGVGVYTMVSPMLQGFARVGVSEAVKLHPS